MTALDLKSNETQLQRFSDEVLSLRGNLSKVSSDLNTKQERRDRSICLHGGSRWRLVMPRIDQVCKTRKPSSRLCRTGSKSLKTS